MSETNLPQPAENSTPPVGEQQPVNPRPKKLPFWVKVLIWGVIFTTFSFIIIPLAKTVITQLTNSNSGTNTSATISSTVSAHPDFIPTDPQKSLYATSFTNLGITNYSEKEAETYGLNTCQYIKDKNPTATQLLNAIVQNKTSVSEAKAAGEAAGSGISIFCPQYQAIIAQVGNLNSK